MSGETEDIASRFFAAIERGDLAAVRELYAPDVQIWHNVTGRSQTRDENLKLLRFFTGRVSELRYELLARELRRGAGLPGRARLQRTDRASLRVPRPGHRPRCIHLASWAV